MGNFDGSEELSATLNGECTSQYDIIINNNVIMDLWNSSLKCHIYNNIYTYTYITKEHHSTCLQCIMNISV